MKQRLITLALVAGCIFLGVIAFFTYVGQDKKAPQIKVKKESITYTEGDNYDVLLKGVSAKDNVDGDLSDKVFVDKIISAEDGKAVVYYGVMDSNYNVGTARRRIDYIKKEPEEELKPNGKNPAMALTTTEMTIQAGTEFDVLSVIKGVVDDVDDADTLYKHVHAEGEYDTQTPGVYELYYYVSDSEGNTSEPHTFTLTVQ